MKAYSGERVGVVVGLSLLVFALSVMGAPSSSSASGDDSGGTGGGRMITVQSVLGRNRMKNGDVDPQTRKDFRILSMFESELNKIFSCYIRLSCPRTRSPDAIAQCEEIKDWPLYHQVMKMSGIKRYPYQQYAPQRQLIGGRGGTHHLVVEDNETGNSHQEPGALRVRRHQRRQRRNEVEQNDI